MASILGTKRKPAILRVPTKAHALALYGLCQENGWQAIIGIEPDKPEDTADLKRLLRARDIERRLAGDSPAAQA